MPFRPQGAGTVQVAPMPWVHPLRARHRAPACYRMDSRRSPASGTPSTRLDEAIQAENSALGAQAPWLMSLVDRARERDPRPFLFFHEAAADIRRGQVAGSRTQRPWRGPPATLVGGPWTDAGAFSFTRARDDPYFFHRRAHKSAGRPKRRFRALAGRTAGNADPLNVLDPCKWKGPRTSAACWVPCPTRRLRSSPSWTVWAQHKADEGRLNSCLSVEIFEVGRDLGIWRKYLVAWLPSNRRTSLPKFSAGPKRRPSRSSKARKGDTAGDSELSCRALDDLAQKRPSMSGGGLPPLAQPGSLFLPPPQPRTIAPPLAWHSIVRGSGGGRKGSPALRASGGNPPPAH